MVYLSANQYLKIGLIYSLLAAIGLVYQTLGWILTNVSVFVVFLGSYPVTKLFTAETKRSWFDLGFILLVIPMAGSILAFSSTYPLGFGDVHAHIEATMITVESGFLNPLSRPSFNLVGLYILADVLSCITGLEMPTIATYLPLFTLTATALMFYRFIDGETKYRGIPLVATYIFIFTWGVFRFIIEYRTLNIGYLFVVTFIGIILKYRSHVRKLRRVSVLLLILGSALAISHFATFLFFLLLVTAVYVSGSIKGHKQYYGYTIVYSVITLFTYMTYLGDGSIISISRFMIVQFASIVSDTSVSSGRTKGLIGMTYGNSLFLVRWFLRIGFIIAFVTVAVYHRDTKLSWFNFAFIAAGILGGLLFYAATIGFALTPSRVLTFFAIPFAIIYSEGIRIGRISSFTKGLDIRSVLSLLLICMMFLALVLAPMASIMKFPSNMIGDTEPIRGQEPVDTLSYYEIDNHDVNSRYFLSTYGTEYQSIEILYGPGSPTVREFYLSTLPPRIFEEPNGEVEYVITDQRRSTEQHQIYSSGGVYILS